MQQTAIYALNLFQGARLFGRVLILRPSWQIMPFNSHLRFENGSYFTTRARSFQDNPRDYGSISTERANPRLATWRTEHASTSAQGRWQYLEPTNTQTSGDSEMSSRYTPDSRNSLVSNSTVTTIVIEELRPAEDPQHGEISYPESSSSQGHLNIERQRNLQRIAERRLRREVRRLLRSEQRRQQRNEERTQYLHGNRQRRDEKRMQSTYERRRQRDEKRRRRDVKRRERGEKRRERAKRRRRKIARQACRDGHRDHFHGAYEFGPSAKR